MRRDDIFAPMEDGKIDGRIVVKTVFDRVTDLLRSLTSPSRRSTWAPSGRPPARTRRGRSASNAGEEKALGPQASDMVDECSELGQDLPSARVIEKSAGDRR